MKSLRSAAIVARRICSADTDHTDLSIDYIRDHYRGLAEESIWLSIGLQGD
jgi:hypothetical protein